MEDRNEDGKDILTEIIETASQYVSDDLDAKIPEAVERAILDILRKYGRISASGAPVFIDESGNKTDVTLDSGTPRHGGSLSPEFIENLLRTKYSLSGYSPEGVINEDAISPTNPTPSDETEKGKKGKKKKEKKPKEGTKLDRIIEREDKVNSKLNKLAYAFLLNTPGVAQVAMGKQLKQMAVVNNDQKPIPVVIVTDLNRSESMETKKKRRKDLEVKIAEQLKEMNVEEAKTEVKEENGQTEAEEESVVVLEISEEPTNTAESSGSE